MCKRGQLLLLCLFCLSLTGCYDAQEVDQQLHVLVIGIDQGVTDKWRLSVQVMMVDIEKQSTDSPPSGTSKAEAEDVLIIEAPSFFAAVNLLNTFRARKLMFHHAHVIVLSEELARSGRISEFIAPINRFIEIRHSAHMIVVKGRADEFLKENTPLAGSLISEDLRLLLDQANTTGFYPIITLQQFYGALKSPYDQPIVTLGAVNESKTFVDEGEPWGTTFKVEGSYFAGEVPRKGQNKIEFLGTALFRGDLMVGELTGEETRYLLMARGEFKRGYFTIPDPRRPDLIVALDVRSLKKPQVKVDVKGPNPIIDLKIRLDVDVLAIQSDIQYEQPDLKRVLEKELQEFVATGIEEVVEKCQNLNTDVFLFGQHSTKRFLTIEDLENYNWNGRFQDAEVNVEVEAIIRRTGRILRF